jgi:lantibiotic biosynthesis protein
VASQLAGDPEMRKKLRLRLNDCGYISGSRWHYVDWSQALGARTYSLSSVELSAPLQRMLAMVGRSGRQVGELVDEFCSLQPEFSRDAVEAFVVTLIDNRVVLVSLEPQLTGEPRLAALLDDLQGAGSDIEALGVLKQTHQSLQLLDAGGPGAKLSDYARIEHDIRSLGVAVDTQRLFQVDLHRLDDTLSLSPELAAEISRAFELRLRLLARRNGDLDEFCRKFSRRYEGRRVPLLEVLDEETGIGEGRWTDVPSELLDGVGWRSTAPDQSCLFEAQLIAASLQRDGGHQREINLEPAQVPELDAELVRSLPDVVATVATLVGSSVAAIEQGEWTIWIHGFMGSVAAHMTGRFCQGDPKLTAHVRAGLEREAQFQPDAVFAEVVHLPQEQYGNLVSRPLLRPYEIPLLGRSGAPGERQIPLSDLEIEVRGTDILLWSKGLNKRVIPRMSAAHNYDGNTLGIYRFMCRLQQHNGIAESAAVGQLLGRLDRVPRIRCGRVILFPARWNMSRERASKLIESDPAHRRDALAVLRGELDLPRWVGIADGDNVLSLDLESGIAIEVLVAAFNKTERLQLVELFLSPDELCAGTGKDRFVHELVLPLIRNRKQPDVPGIPTRSSAEQKPGGGERSVHPGGGLPEAAEAERLRLPGSDWLSYRIFGGPAMLDRVLANCIGEHADRWRELEWIEDWFFIRYADPSPHLRVRFRGQPGQLVGKVLPGMHRLSEQLLGDRLIDDVEIVAYRRELERYGGAAGIGLCEQWFGQESRRIAALLAKTRGGPSRWRWQLAMAGLVRDLSDLGLEPDGLLALFETIADGFRREFRMEKGRLASLGRKYRALTAEVCAACSGELPGDFPHPEHAARILDSGGQERRRIGRQLRELSANGRLYGTVESLLPSFVHMTCNRWFVDRPRANEMVLYDLMRRGLSALRARGHGPWAKPGYQAAHDSRSSSALCPVGA